MPKPARATRIDSPKQFGQLAADGRACVGELYAESALQTFVPKIKVELVYAGLRVRNLARSLAFYKKVGFRVHRRGTMGHGGQWVHLRFPGAHQRVELNYYPPGNAYYEPIRKGTEFDHLGFRVSNVEACEAWLRRKGLPVVARIREPHENLVYTRDPDGNWLEFFGPVPAAS